MLNESQRRKKWKGEFDVGVKVGLGIIIPCLGYLKAFEATVAEKKTKLNPASRSTSFILSGEPSFPSR
jgi:hypothetical protein